MRWYRVTEKQKEAQRKTAGAIWQRRFAWLPCHDEQSHIVYWMEFVWCRGTDWSYTTVGRWFGSQWYNYTEWEYRGGKEAPEVKQPPPGTPSTPL